MKQTWYLLAHLFVKVPRPGVSEVTFAVFESSCHLLLSTPKVEVEAIPLSALPKNTTIKIGGLSSHYPFNAERQAVKL